MPFIETLQDGLDRVLPRKMKSNRVPAVIGIGNGSGMVNYEDDVSAVVRPHFFHTLLLSVLHTSLLTPQNLLRVIRISKNLHFNLLLRNQPLSSMPLHGPVWDTGLPPLPASTMGCLACGHSHFSCIGMIRLLTFSSFSSAL